MYAKALRAGLLVLLLGLAGAPALATDSKPSPDTADFGQDEQVDRKDPLEPINRPIAAFNRFLRQILLDPMVKIYKANTPDPLEQAIKNVASNLREPFNVVGSLVAGEGAAATAAGGRFLINTTLGLGGVRDVATKAGLTYCREDIGQGLANRGVESGTHIVAPIIGPTNVRDLPGDIVEVLVSPLPGAVTVAQAGVEYADKQQAVEQLNKEALDPYVAEREAYEQNRLYQVEIKCRPPSREEQLQKPDVSTSAVKQ